MKMQFILKKLKETGFFHVFGSSTINKVLSFASGIVLVRLIPKTDYGIYSYAYSILSFFLIFSGLGASSGILQMCSESSSKEKRMQIYLYGCRSSTLINIGLSFIIILIAILYPLKITGANICLASMAFLPCIMCAFEIQSIHLRAELKNREYAYSNSFATIAIFLLSCMLAYLLGVPGLITARYLAYSAAVLFVIFKFSVPYPINKVKKLDRETSHEFWKISLISMTNNGLSALMYILDIFVLGIFIPDSAVIASYKVATDIPTALAFIPAAVTTYVYPYFARHREDKEWVKKRYKQLSLAIGLGSILISAIMILCAPIIIQTIFGKAYLDAVPSFRILCLSFSVSSTLRILPGNILVTQRKLKFNLIIAFISSALNTVLNVLLILKWNSTGAALATLITVTVSGVLNVLYLCKTLGASNKAY